MKYIQRKNLNFSTFKSDQMRFLATELEKFGQFWTKNWRFIGRIARPNHKSPYFLEKACLAKSLNSLFFGQSLFGENAKVPIFKQKKSPYFKQTSV